MPASLLDRFMPKYDVAVRHTIRIDAPAHVALAAAYEQDILRSRIARVLFRLRELILRAQPPPASQSGGLLEWMRKLGWGWLAEEPGRELVMGVITQPWLGNVVFRPLPAEEFVEHTEPDHVKIALSLRAEPFNSMASTFVTETRAVACDAEARRKFLRYWRIFSPGIHLIRLALLRPLKKEAERRARQADPAPFTVAS